MNYFYSGEYLYGGIHVWGSLLVTTVWGFILKMVGKKVTSYD
jgi:hypothetical protein